MTRSLPWTETEVDLLRRMRDENRTPEFMADCLGRSLGSVRIQLSRLGIGYPRGYFGEPSTELEAATAFERNRASVDLHIADIEAAHGRGQHWASYSFRGAR